MKVHRISFLFAILALLFVSMIPAQAQGERRVWAFYLGFWAGGQSWESQAAILDDYPAIGLYDSRNPGVAATQIDQAKSAGIDGFVVSWFGLQDGQTTTPALNNLLDRAAERGFQVGAAIDGFDSSFYNRDILVASLNWLVHERSQHPAYLRYQGKPVIFFAFQNNFGLSASDWQDIRNAVDPNHNTIWIAEGLNGCCIYGAAMDGMYAFNLAWANGSSGTYSGQRSRTINAGGSIYIPIVHPGWNEDRIAARDGRGNPTSPRDRANGQFLANSFQGAVASGADIILIGTWNEFMENSHIEPSQLYGTNALDTLRPLATTWKAGAAPSAGTSTSTTSAQDNEPAVEATVALNVRAGASTDYNILGKIAPGTWYRIIREENGWYIIDYNGAEGFVSSRYVRARGVTSASTNAAAPDYPAVQARSRLNVRAGASTDYDILGVIVPGAWYRIIREESGWYIIDYNGAEGFVSNQFVQRN